MATMERPRDLQQISFALMRLKALVNMIDRCVSADEVELHLRTVGDKVDPAVRSKLEAYVRFTQEH